MSRERVDVGGAFDPCCRCRGWRVSRHHCGTLGDRAVAFDMLGAVVSCGVLVAVADDGDGLLLDLAIVLGLLGFLTSVTVARFIESRDKGEQ